MTLPLDSALFESREGPSQLDQVLQEDTSKPNLH